MELVQSLEQPPRRMSPQTYSPPGQLLASEGNSESLVQGSPGAQQLSALPGTGRSSGGQGGEPA